jgi:hypothetical protein
LFAWVIAGILEGVMLSSQRYRLQIASVCFVGLITAAGSRADQFVNLLPADADVIVSVNVGQLTSGPSLANARLLQSLVAEWTRDDPSLKKQLEELSSPATLLRLQKLFASLELNVFKDIHRVSAATKVGEDKDGWVAVVEGKFKPEKFRAVVQETAAKNPEHIKIGCLGKTEYCEWVVTEAPERRVYLLPLNADVVVIAENKSALAAVVERATRPSKQNAGEVPQAADSKQALTVALKPAALVSTLEKRGAVGYFLPTIKKMIHDIGAVSVGLTLEHGVRLEIGLTTRDEQIAKKVRSNVNRLRRGIVYAVNAVDRENLGELIGILRGLRIVSEGKVVFVRGQVPGDFIDTVMNAGD